MKTKLLFICSFNVDRSPAGEAMFRNSKKYEAKSAGVDPRATKQVSIEDVKWADIIFVMDDRNEGHKIELVDRFGGSVQMDIRVLGIPNYFSRYDPELYRLLRVRLENEGIDVDETNYEDFVEGLESKKEFEILEGEKVEKKTDKPFQITFSQGSGKTHILSMLYSNNLSKKLIVNPDVSIGIKEEAKKKDKPKETRKGWRNYQDPKKKDNNKIGWVK